MPIGEKSENVAHQKIRKIRKRKRRKEGGMDSENMKLKFQHIKKHHSKTTYGVPIIS